MSVLLLSLLALLVLLAVWWRLRGRPGAPPSFGPTPPALRCEPAAQYSEPGGVSFHLIGTPFSLEVTLGPLPNDTRKVRSSGADGGVYLVSLTAQTCSCPDFFHRAGRPHNHFGRWCKHLVAELDRAGAFEPANKWHKAIAGERRGGPTHAFLVGLERAPEVLITRGGGDWINVYGHSLRRGERIAEASGRITQSGWSVSEQRWARGDGPPGAGELRKLFRATDWGR